MSASISTASANSSGHLLPVVLRPAEKRTLDLPWDWPRITPSHLCGLMGVEARRMSNILAALEKQRLVVRLRAEGGRRLALTDRGLSLLTRRDRTSVGAARRRWSAERVDAASPPVWRNVADTRNRQLLRHIGHTEAVHWFVAVLSSQAHDGGWEVVQLDPPHRASRYFRHRGRLHSVRSEAFGVLRRDGGSWPFFLGWERRAVRPVTMVARLAPYLRLLLDEEAHRRSRNDPVGSGGLRGRAYGEPIPARCTGGDAQGGGSKFHWAFHAVACWKRLGRLGPCERTPEPLNPFAPSAKAWSQPEFSKSDSMTSDNA